MPNSQKHYSTNTKWEQLASYSRAIRVGDRILVSGTTATPEEIAAGLTDPGEQARAVLEKIRLAVEALGGSLADIVRIRTYISDASYVESVALVHGEDFKDINPANTLIQAGLIGEGVLVEIEAEAVLDELSSIS